MRVTPGVPRDLARGQASRGTFLVPGDKGGPALAMVYCGFGFWLFAAFGTASLFGSIYTGALRYLALARVVTRFGVFGTKLAPFLQQSVCNKCVYIRVCKGVFQQLRHFWFSVLCAFGFRFCALVEGSKYTGSLRYWNQARVVTRFVRFGSAFCNKVCATNVCI